MQHLGVNFGHIWRSELTFFIWFFLGGVLHKKSGLIFKSPVATLPATGSLRHVLFTQAFVTIHESTAAVQSSSLLNAKFTFKRTSPTNHFLHS